MSDGLKAVFWDLDGTLLRMDIHEFLGRYLPEISRALPGQDPASVGKAIMDATLDVVMSPNDPRANMDKFKEAFIRRVPVTGDEAFSRFNAFYDREFYSLGTPYAPDPDAIMALSFARDKGLVQALTTNPIFPMRALLHRMAWAGIDASLFAHITSYENSNACKPHAKCFLDVAALLEVEPGNVLVVGNDIREDMEPAHRAGMRTFLVEGYVIDNGSPSAVDARGGFTTLVKVMESLL